MTRNFTIALAFLLLISASLNAQKTGSIKGEEVSYLSAGKTMKSYIAYDEKQVGKRPAIIVVPEWWGVNDYTKMRAKMLAELGYIAIAVDMYGEGKIAADPKEAGELATPFYKDFQLDVERIQAAANKLKEYPQTDSGRMSAIGYCFGGSMVLNAAKPIL
jgi:dienelactone hydrolase